MRFLTILVITVSLLYSGYWFVGSRAVQNGTETALNDLRADGWIVEVGDVNTRGFPSRFDTTVSEVFLASPGDGFSYRAPFVQAFALSYAPYEVIAAFPPEQKVRFGLQTIDVLSTDLRASAAVRTSTSAALDNVTLESADLSMVSDFGWDLAAKKVLAAMRQAASGDSTYDVFLDTDDVTLPKAITDAIGGQTPLPPQIASIEVDVQATLDKPIDRFAFEAGAVAPRPVTLKLRRLTADWGTAQLSGSGELSIAADGAPDGRVTLEITSWDQLIGALVALGVVEAGIAPTLQNMANTLAQGNESLSVPISFQNGFMSVGPLPLGPAPKFF